MPKRRGDVEYQSLTLWDRPRGVNTFLPPGSLGLNDAETAQNLRIMQAGGRLMYATRPGLTKVTSTATESGAAVAHIKQVPIDGTDTLLVVDANDKLYKPTGSMPTLTMGSAVKTLEGETQIVPFSGEAVLLDGSYIKLYDGSTVSLAYDDGSGSSGYNYNKTCVSCDDQQNLYSGSVTRAGAQFTSQTLDSGYTVPLTRIEAWLSITGSPTGTVSAKLYNNDGSSLLATASTTLNAASDLTTSNKKYTFDVDLGDYDLASATSYIAAIEYSGGDSSNYVTVHGATVASGGNGYTYNGSWSADATIDFAIGVGAGRPPQGYCGDVKEARLYVGNNGRLHYSNVNTALDWSTTNGGGYVSAVDDDANSFPIGAVAAFYGDLYIVGKQAQPYLSKLTGSSPENYALPPLFQEVYTDPKQISVAANDVYLVSGDNAYRLSGVQEYGDIRAGAIGDSIYDVIVDNWTTAGFSIFNPRDGQLWWCAGGGSATVYVIHVKRAMQDEAGIHVPVTTYVFKNLTPTAFGLVDGDVIVGTSTGHLYKYDRSVVTDGGTGYDVDLKSATGIAPFGSMKMREFNVPLKSDASVSATMSVFLDGNSSATVTKALSGSNGASQYTTNFACDSFQFRLSSWSFTDTVYLGGIVAKARKLGRRGMNSTGSTAVVNPVTATGSEQVVDSFSTSLGTSVEWKFTVRDASGNVTKGGADCSWNTAGTVQLDEHMRQVLGTQLSITVAADISSSNVRLKLTAPSGSTIYWERNIIG